MNGTLGMIRFKFFESLSSGRIFKVAGGGLGGALCLHSSACQRPIGVFSPFGTQPCRHAFWQQRFIFQSIGSSLPTRIARRTASPVEVARHIRVNEL